MPLILARRAGGHSGVAVRLLAALLGTALLAIPARAEPQQANDRHAGSGAFELERTAPGALAVDLGALALLGGGVLLLGTPDACRWCDPTAFDTALHDPAAPEARNEAAAASQVLAYALLPSAALSVLAVPAWRGVDPDRHALENAAIVLEVALLDWTLTRAAKVLVARRRPAFYYGRAEAGQFDDQPSEAYQSFFSADASLAFAFASAASTISFQRGYASAPYVAVVGGVLAASVAVLRVRADVHWPSDVLAGALVGSAVGIGWPLLAHSRHATPGARLGIVPRFGDGTMGAAVAGSF